MIRCKNHPAEPATWMLPAFGTCRAVFVCTACRHAVVEAARRDALAAYVPIPEDIAA